MKFFKNKNGYLLCTKVTVNETLLDEVNVINDKDVAEKLFREINEIPPEYGVFIPEIILDIDTDTLFAEQLNTALSEVKTTIEQYINEYTV